MKVTIKEWNAVASWRWNMPEDEVCGICRVQFDGTCPTCKFPGDDCSLCMFWADFYWGLADLFFLPLSARKMRSFFPHALPLDMDPTRVLEGALSDVQTKWYSEMSSLPKQYNPVFSSSPSRHSPFREGAAATATNTNIAASASLPIERNGQPQITQRPSLGTHETHGNYGHDEGYGDEEEEEGDVNRPDPDFKPFFTLIEDENSGDYHHPTVHYIFSDDDPDLITEASLRALQGDGHDSLGQNIQGSNIEEGSEDILHKPSFLPPPMPGVKERFLILDVEQTNSSNNNQGGPSSAPDAQPQFATSAGTVVSTSPAQKQATHGYRIASAHSLTPDWQVLNTSLSLAPTFDTPQMTNDPDADPNASSSGALMLRIEGTAGFPRDVASGKDRDAKSQTLEEMMEQFEKRMSELRRVIEAGGDRHRAPDGGTEAHEAQPTGAGVVAHDAEPSVPEASPT
ncbi:uncharacterized protein TRUGW13939_11733 [Talaromyces rugulosus]|uniref:Anaphase-promoting complex subunit 11 RING-H2 finger domain-containing protein n=1 Tax=Talaromyces rugulosus TaxID=121627 RepID=A0A7H8REV8_TALRU|nr:uncharacterized protein TRUGW13939_11733 [Talaromyces rugulosus]QKX64558.1 hypothetical protein TRUGW13939_11733 [Talaromyces rugulosus]